jgi:SHS2 domain-containing protein
MRPLFSQPTYTLLDHTADLRIRVVGADRADLFTNAGLALFDLIVEGPAAGGADEIDVHVTGQDAADLLVNFLRELLYLWTGHEKAVTVIQVTHISDTSVSARVTTVGFVPQRQHVVHEIKAVTYHQIDVSPTGTGWQATVVFDI